MQGGKEGEALECTAAIRGIIRYMQRVAGTLRIDRRRVVAGAMDRARKANVKLAARTMASYSDQSSEQLWKWRDGLLAQKSALRQEQRGSVEGDKEALVEGNYPQESLPQPQDGDQVSPLINRGNQRTDRATAIPSSVPGSRSQKTLSALEGLIQAGQIKHHLQEWREITRNPVILGWVEEGFKLPLQWGPKTFRIDRSSNQYRDESRKLMEEYLERKVICKPVLGESPPAIFREQLPAATRTPPPLRAKDHHVAGKIGEITQQSGRK